jgi:hypothetical protein
MFPIVLENNIMLGVMCHLSLQINVDSTTFHMLPVSHLQLHARGVRDNPLFLMNKAMKFLYFSRSLFHYLRHFRCVYSGRKITLKDYIILKQLEGVKFWYIQ